MSVIIQTPTVQNESDKRLPCHLSSYESPPRRSPKYGGDRRNPSLLASQPPTARGARQGLTEGWACGTTLSEEIFLAEKNISCGEKFISCGKIYFLRKKIYFLWKKIYFLRRKIFLAEKNISCGKKYFLRKKIYFLRRKIYFLRRKIYFLRRKIFLAEKKYFLRKNIFCTMLPISFRTLFITDDKILSEPKT